MDFRISSFLVLVVVSTCYAESNFILTLPKTIYSGSTSEFCLTLYDTASAKLTLTPLENTGKTSVEVEDNYINGQQKCTQFQVPQQGRYEVLLTSKALDDDEPNILHNGSKISVMGSKLITFVQTDKPIYKPGQKVMFRVFTLMRNLQPRIGNIKSIFIKDPNDIRVKQFLDVETKGIGSFEFQLIEEAKLGKWSIEVYLDDDDEILQKGTFGEFEVKEYVLPRFEVKITAPKHIFKDDHLLKGKVCAQYTYGKPVSGFLHLVLFSSMNIHRYSSGDHQEQVVKISGCYEFSFNVTVKGSAMYYPYKINATVTEDGTGAISENYHEGPRVSFETLNIEIEDFTKGYFKPGLPYYGKVKASMIDGSPAVGKKIKISILDNDRKVQFTEDFVTESDGTFVYSVCDGLSKENTSVQFMAEEINTDPKIYSSRGYKHVQQWFSPSLTYIQIPQLQAPLQCGTKVALNILFTTRQNTPVKFYYQVTARAKLVTSGQVSYDESQSHPSASPPQYKCLHKATEAEKNVKAEERGGGFPPGRPWGYFPAISDQNSDYQEKVELSEYVADKVSNFILDLDISSEMSPQFTLLIYHILPDGEVIADGKQFDVQPCFNNQVKMAFQETTVVPGDKIDIKINAEAESICAVGIVDKSVNILGGNHQVTPEMIFKKIEEFNIRQPVDYGWEEEYCKKRLTKTQESDDFMFYYSTPYVDANQAFENFKVITNLKLDTRPCSRNRHVFYDSMPLPGLRASLEDNIPISMRSSSIESTSLASKSKIARSNFPETWLWDLHMVGNTGETILHETAPHTITSWVGNVLCVNEQNGFGVSSVTSLRTFQPFFLSLQLPYAAVRGEKLPIMFTVYNYLEKCLHIQLSLDVEKKFAIDKINPLGQPVCLCGGASHTAKIYVTPKAIGQLPLTAKAEIIPGLCGNSVDMDTTYIGLSDTVKRNMFVKAEGIEQSYTNTMFMCTKDGSPKEEQLILSIPADEEVVKDSSRGEVKVIGDIMGSALINVDNLIKMPYGCGEQNMVGFVPNIFALKYLEKTGRLTEDMKSKALKFMEVGYQRELTFRHKDGSYSAFGESDPEGSIWLTAFVVKSYAQAQPYIYIDERDLKVSLAYLHRNQLETGCFRETGKVFSSYMMGGLGGSDKEGESFTALTAYVAIALLTAGVNSTEPGIYGAMECINNDFMRLKEAMDPYSLSLVAYANALYSPFSLETSEVLEALETVAKTDGDLKYWARQDFTPKVSNNWYSYTVPSAEVEMTSYVLLSYIKFYGPKAVEKTHNIAMWLSKQRNPYGGFSSTQDTVVGLNALSEYARLAFNGGKTELKVSVTGEKLKQVFSISQKRKTTLLLQRTAIPVLPNQITVNADGEGCALVQFSLFYNKLSKDFKDRSSFHLEVFPNHYHANRDKCDYRTLVIRVGAKGKQRDSSGMAMLDLKMVTGWTPVPESLAKIKLQLIDVKKIEYAEGEGVVSFYFDELSRKPTEIKLDVKQDRELAVSSPKPADVKVYYYYETEVFMVHSYKIKTTCGTKEEIPHIVPDSADGIPGPNQVRINPGLDVQFRMSLGLEPCPLCITIPTVPTNFKDFVCNSSAAYKVAVLKGKSFKLLQNLRPVNVEKKINLVLNFTLPSGCTCNILNNQGKKAILLVPSKFSAEGKSVQLDNKSLILTEHRKFFKAIREFQKTCEIKPVAEKKKKKEQS